MFYTNFIKGIAQKVSRFFLVILIFDIHLQGHESLAKEKAWTDDCPDPMATLKSPKYAEDLKTCSNALSDERRIHLIQSQFGEIADNSYLASLANERTNSLNCAEIQIKGILQKKENFEAYTSQILSLIPMLAQESRTIEFNKPGKWSNLEGLRKYKVARARADQLLASIPMIEIAEVRSMVESLATNFSIVKNEGFDENKIDKMRDSIRHSLNLSMREVSKNKVKLDQGIQTFGESFDNEMRESLARDSHLVEQFQSRFVNAKDQILPVACRVDRHFRRDAEWRDNGLMGVGILTLVMGYGVGRLPKFLESAPLLKAIPVTNLSTRAVSASKVIYAAGASSGLAEAVFNCPGAYRSLSTRKIVANPAVCERDMIKSISEMNCLLGVSLAALGGVGTYANLPKSKLVFEKLAELNQVAVPPRQYVKMNANEIAIIPEKVIYKKPLRPEIKNISDMELGKDGVWREIKESKDHGVLKLGYKKPEERTFGDKMDVANFKNSRKGATTADVDRMNMVFGFDRNSAMRFIPNPPEILGKEVPVFEYNRAMSRGEIYFSNGHDLVAHIPGYARLGFSPSWPKTKDILQRLFKIYDDPLTSADLKKRVSSAIYMMGSRIDHLTVELTVADASEVIRQIKIATKAPWHADTYVDYLALREAKVKDLDLINARFENELRELGDRIK